MKIICDGLTGKLKYCKTHEELLRIALKKVESRTYLKWPSIFMKESEELLTFQSKVANISTFSKKTSNQSSSDSSYQRDRGRQRSIHIVQTVNAETSMVGATIVLFVTKRIIHLIRRSVVAKIQVRQEIKTRDRSNKMLLWLRHGKPQF